MWLPLIWHDSGLWSGQSGKLLRFRLVHVRPLGHHILGAWRELDEVWAAKQVAANHLVLDAPGASTATTTASGASGAYGANLARRCRATATYLNKQRMGIKL